MENETNQTNIEVLPEPAKKLFTLVGNRILFQPDDPKEKSDGGILLPQSAQDAPQEGIVVGVGKAYNDKGEEVKYPVEVGDRILTTMYAGNMNKVKLDGKELKIIEVSDVIGILR